ncbi:MAG TPA: DUF4249 domain-containing protein [Prolixibacteraceae bacterium]|nr:DUF4249 domain-containing protein [Prolixibacteraceae bacterium]
MRNILIFLFLTIITYSCITDYDLDLKSSQSRMVVEGLITNQKGPYLIRLTKSKDRLTLYPIQYSSNGDTSYNYRYPNGVKESIQDAEVFITDKNTSVTDTLIKSPEGEWHYYEGGNNFPVWKRFEVGDTSIINGFYQTTKIKGIPGHTYALTIKWQNQEYHAESYMPEVPPIDSVQFNFTKGAVGKTDYNIPLLFFKEPQNERNYYLFITTESRAWPYSILSDEYLNDYVNGLDVCKGVSPDYWLTSYPDVFDGHLSMDYFIEMHSMTKEGYEYYKALIQQFRTDGGGYSPSPASPPTNLDNGALGFFRASAVNRVDFKSTN